MAHVRLSFRSLQWPVALEPRGSRRLQAPLAIEHELIQTQMAQKPMLRAPFLDDSGTAAAAYWFGDTFSAEWTLQKALECTGLLVNFKELQGC